MAPAEYEMTHPVSIELDGLSYSGTFRVMAGTVIVYAGGDVKFASYGSNRPEVVARWLLSDLSRKQRKEKSARK